MLPTILDLIMGPLGAILAGIATVAAAYFSGRSAGKNKAAREKLEKELERHDRITDADIGIGASDAERRKRLHDMGDKWK